MAIPSTNPPTQKPFSLLLTIFITSLVFLASKVNSSSKALSFNFTTFKQGSSSIILQGDALISSSGTLELTNPDSPSWNTGRALYATSVPLWNATTGNLASFVSTFSFTVSDYDGYPPADGIAFFLAPTDTVIPNNSTGGKLGIVDGSTAFNQVVFVEFDTYSNDWDPDSPHVGINVNSLTSLKSVTWKRESGKLVRVSIIYDSLSKTLSVAVTYTNGRIATVSQVVDLRDVLPERTKVGFSATTTQQRETHQIRSWYFSLTLDQSKC